MLGENKPALTTTVAIHLGKSNHPNNEARDPFEPIIKVLSINLENFVVCILLRFCVPPIDWVAQGCWSVDTRANEEGPTILK